MPPLLDIIETTARQGVDAATFAAIEQRAASLRSEHGLAASTVQRSHALVQAVAAVRGESTVLTYRWFGERVVPHLMPHLQRAIRSHVTSLTLLTQLNRLLHTEVQALAPTAELPDVDVELLDLETVRISFRGRSEDRAMLEGLLLGFASHYQERAHFPLGLHDDPGAEGVAEAVTTLQVVDVAYARDTRDADKPPTRTPPARPGAGSAAPKRGLGGVALTGLFG